MERMQILRDKDHIEAEYKLTHDDLTGLLNRQGFDKRADEKIAMGEPFGLLYLDLTNFKAVNDKHPERHVAGDQVLKTVATILNKTLRTESSNDTQDYVAFLKREKADAGRVGGDEFNVLVDLRPRPDSDIDMPASQRLAIVKERVQKAFQDYVSSDPQLSSLEKGLDIGIGASIWQPGMSAEQLKIAADMDLKQHKDEQHITLGQYRP